MGTNFGVLSDPSQVGASITGAFFQGQEMARKAKEQKAVYDYMQNPTPESASEVGRHNPMMGLQLKQQEEQRQAAVLKQQQDAQHQQITAAALQGDPNARQQLAYFNSDLYRDLGKDQQQQADKLFSAIGQTARSILTLPKEQQEPALQQALAGFQAQGMDISKFKLTGNPDVDLRSALAISGQLDDFEKSQQPQYMSIPEGGTLVNTRDPSAIAQFGGQPQSAPQAAQPQNPAIPQIIQKASSTGLISPEEAQAVQAELGPNGQAAFQGFLQKNGVKIAKQVGGQTYYQIDGKWFDNPEGR